jgi:PAS domain S-box-containing protein
MRPSASRGWERLFWSVFEQSSNPMALITERRRFAEVNPAVVHWLDYTRDELVGKHVWDFLPETEHPILESEWETFLATGQAAGERQLLRGDGLVVHFEFAAHTELVTGRRLVLFVAMHGEIETADGEPVAGGPEGQALSPREREVVELVARGRSGQEIADELGLSPETVRTHVDNAKEKFEARNRAQLVAMALGSGLIHTPSTT